MCFLESFTIFNSSPLPIFSSYYSGLILSLITHSLSSSTCYLLHFTPPLLHCSPLPPLPFLPSALFSRSLLISYTHFCALSYFYSLSCTHPSPCPPSLFSVAHFVSSAFLFCDTHCRMLNPTSIIAGRPPPSN